MPKTKFCGFLFIFISKTAENHGFRQFGRKQNGRRKNGRKKFGRIGKMTEKKIDRIGNLTESDGKTL